ncbi:MAG: tRNA (N(6)-L-threonylcarbamoyladenosine(37)-C(2))-methylthiotransferase MtaB [Cyanobacteria bacterium HKST-UBA06]|nr:tRNA (N(6)-L-threonylcarbamoyladenosine(37)-C(2))-methylthiotransferase MtaB [Cyanobacteria bacterium HKST-UBA06]
METTCQAPDQSKIAPGDKTVAFYALGCRANQLEASALADEFRRHGWQVNDFMAHDAGLVVINTCTVTHGGDSESRRIIRKAKRHNPNARVAVTGCYAQVAPQQVAALDGVNYVIGNNFKQDVFRITTEQPVDPADAPLIHHSEMDKSRIMLGGTTSALNRTRASLKIQDGCDYKCSYCIIPQARGLSRSVPAATLLSQFKQLLEAGFKEVVLTGINIGQYQEPDDGTDLAALLRVLVAIPGDFRIRLSSLDPWEVTDGLLAVLASTDKVCPFVHLSVQSMQDDVLKRMARRHREADVVELCNRLNEALPDIAIGMDIIVGFPGETDRRFETTHAHLSAMPISYLHTFSYSARRQTAAAGFDGQVNEADKKRRSQVLIELAQEKSLAYRRRFMGQTVPVLVEQCGTKGLSPHFIPVQLTGPDTDHPVSAVPNTVVPVTIKAVSIMSTTGQLNASNPL